MYIVTKENVLASVNAETGAIVWRQIFERDDRGAVVYLHLVDDNVHDSQLSEHYRRPEDSTLVTVSGTRNLYLIRGWNARNGNLLWEWTIPTSNVAAHDPNVHIVWYYETNILYQGIINWGSHVDVTAFPGQGGQPLIPPQKVDITKIPRDKCVVSGPYLVCENVEGESVSAIDISVVNEHSVVEDVVKPSLELIEV